MAKDIPDFTALFEQILKENRGKDSRYFEPSETYLPDQDNLDHPYFKDIGIFHLICQIHLTNASMKENLQ
tara:strand:+ start:479 stop:688 length:210 start_codon:yes stop_codon:yes gene_type:complete